MLICTVELDHRNSVTTTVAVSKEMVVRAGSNQASGTQCAPREATHTQIDLDDCRQFYDTFDCKFAVRRVPSGPATVPITIPITRIRPNVRPEVKLGTSHFPVEERLFPTSADPPPGLAPWKNFSTPRSNIFGWVGGKFADSHKGEFLISLIMIWNPRFRTTSGPNPSKFRPLHA